MLRSGVGRVLELLHVLTEPLDLLIHRLELVQLGRHVRGDDAERGRVRGKLQLDLADVLDQVVHVLAVARPDVSTAYSESPP